MIYCDAAQNITALIVTIGVTLCIILPHYFQYRTATSKRRDEIITDYILHELMKVKK